MTKLPPKSLPETFTPHLVRYRPEGTFLKGTEIKIGSEVLMIWFKEGGIIQYDTASHNGQPNNDATYSLGGKEYPVTCKKLEYRPEIPALSAEFEFQNGQKITINDVEINRNHQRDI